MPSPPFLFYFSFIFLFQAHVITVAKIDTSCVPFSCGSFKNITYPFSNINTQAKLCGHPKFKVDCQHGNLTLVIKSQKFIILKVNQSSQLLTIAREDLYFPDTLPTCALKYMDVEVDMNFFDYTFKNMNYTLLSECVQDPLTYPFNSKIHQEISQVISCIKDGKYQKSYLVWSSRAQDYIVLDCKKKITIIGFNNSITNNNYNVDQGFEVKWRGVEQEICDRCIISGKRCVYNSSQKAMVCISAAVPSTPLAPTSNGTWKLKRTIIIGVISIVSAILLVIISICWCRNTNSSAESHINSTDLTLQRQRFSKSQNFGVQHFIYDDLKRATNSFSIENRIADGGSGAVYKGLLDDGREVAVKHLNKHHFAYDRQFQNEITVLAQVVHPNLVLLYGCTTLHSREALVVYELVVNGTVADHLHIDKAPPAKLPWSIRMRIAVETASALQYLHACRVIHRDIKTNNILLDPDYHVKVADFGLARFIPMDHSRVLTISQGTPGYLDPEYTTTNVVTYKTDVYCFGVVLIELVTSFPAYDFTKKNTGDEKLSETAMRRISNKTFDGIVDRTLGFDSDSRVRYMINGVIELSYQCLQSSGDMRPTMEEVFQRLLLLQNEILPEAAESSSHNEEIRLINNDLASPSTF